MNCHLVISIVLGQAEKEMRIPLNPAHRASPPKREASDPNYFQMEEVAKILKALEAEPIKWRAAVHLLLVSGCRRGELLGLKWDHVNWESGQIHIDCTLLYAGDRGVYEGTPKTRDSVRTIKLPEETMALLEEYRQWQEAQRQEEEPAYTEEDLDLLSRVIYAEVGCTWIPDWVQRMVGSVVLNRVNSPYYPDTIYDVIYQPGQYAPTWDGSIYKTPDARTIENARYLLENGSICPENVVGQNSIITGSGVYTSYQDPILGTTVYFCYL